MIPEDKIQSLLDRYEELEVLMAEGGSGDFVKLSKEYADLGKIVEKARIYKNAQQELIDLKAMMDDASDSEMRALAETEYFDLKEQMPEIEKELQLMLLPKDAADERSAIIEIRAGTGGDEAAIFAGDLFRMYDRYAAVKGWKVELLSETASNMGGYKEIIATITGSGVFAKLKFESGVHRVQRVPDTEASGRIHTSAATVAVLPEMEEVDVEIRSDDLRIDVFRASGAGGQHVNKTESAVRITHLPTGTVVSMQDEKSQIKNRERAMKILCSRIYETERQRIANERSAERKGQVGSGDRSERIRTYNYPQGRVTDHRINLTLYKLEQIMEGEILDELIDPLVMDDQMQKLASYSESY